MKKSIFLLAILLTSNLYGQIQGVEEYELEDALNGEPFGSREYSDDEGSRMYFLFESLSFKGYESLIGEFEKVLVANGHTFDKPTFFDHNFEIKPNLEDVSGLYENVENHDAYCVADWVSLDPNNDQVYIVISLKLCSSVNRIAMYTEEIDALTAKQKRAFRKMVKK